MSQNVTTSTDAANTSGTELATQIDAQTAAWLTTNAGAARPTYAQVGTFWVQDDVSPLNLYFYNGVQDVLMATIDTATHVIEWSFLDLLDDHLSLHDLGYLMGAPTIYDTAGSATYTTPTDAKALLIEVLGAGGGGGGATSISNVARVGGGGGAGSYCKHLEEAPLDASYPVNVGAGGAGGAGTSDGSAGGDTSFGSILTSAGGTGGTNSGSSNADATVTFVPDPAARPATGNIARVSGTSGNRAIKLSANYRSSGAGFSSFYGAGGAPVSSASSGSVVPGKDGIGNGSGGSGALGSTAAGSSGGNGTPGLIIITPLF